ncbi:HD-GYP domain-containing protein [Pseudohalioglobus lutimaris]|uniref:DUF3391 domain-containing protein n=1 Tax=Pseudohalioglobus lutimaris TaxID=1737061 RepID=A0A2N5X8G4_9GAMM|nr:HD-GYP domain-containing protein [Pseudohalioglobus lutimaris]PLW70782.1 DUF3391 domain-containing protein [Pseudohalioglobus lutimaris]
MSRFYKTHVDDLKLGMFVSDLDRPWTDSPFLLQGFTIDSIDELATLRDLCSYVHVDVGLSKHVEDYALQNSHGGRKRTKVIAKMFPDRTLVTYEDVFTFEGEVGSAEKVFKDYENVIGNIYKSVETSGNLDMVAVSKTVTRVVGSIVRNPDACMLLSAISKKDSYSYSHALSSSVLAAALGRQIGLPVHDLKTLATGALLCDIGKLEIPSTILNKSAPLTEQEWQLVKDHVSLGMKILEDTTGVSPEVKAIVANHHERYDGRGYPAGLSGKNIPPLARVAGLVDCYDAMISDRSYASGVSPADAISKLYTMRDLDFEAELVEEFIQTVGIYPVGSVVELTDGRVGVVVTEHRRRRLRPRILILLNSDKRQLVEPSYVNLLEETEDQAGRPLEILKGVDPSAYNLHPEDLTF